MLSNIICEKLDIRLNAAAKRFNLKYSRYADDITFSSMHNVYQKDSEFLKEINRIITQQNFHIQENKTRLQKSDYRQEVTGVVVNEKINIQKRYIKQLRQWLYEWERKGKDKANELFQGQYITDKGNLKKGQPDMANVIHGKLCYLKMIKGAENPAFEKLVERYYKLTGRKCGTQIPEESKITNKRVHRPTETNSFLSLFHNSKGLKFLTHPFSEKQNYEDFIKLCKKEFKEAKNKYPHLPEALSKRIEHFAFKKSQKWFIRKGTKRNNIKKGWSHPSFIEWFKKSNIHPALDSEWNQKMIIPFKESIEVRAGTLVTIVDSAIDDVFKESKSNYDIRKDDKELDTAEFYTDVDQFRNALFIVFTTIKQMAEKNLCFDFSIDYQNEQNENGKFKKVIITHIQSEATKKAKDPNFIKGDLINIRTALWGLCNYEIIAKFPDGYYKKVILTDVKEEIVKTFPIENIQTSFLQKS